MSGKAYCLTKRRLTDDHYLAIALREARDMHKPPITLANSWKHSQNHDQEELLGEIYQWLERETEMGDYVVLDGDDVYVKAIATYAKEHRLVPVRAIWEPEATIRDL